MRIRYRLRHPIKMHEELNDVSYAPEAKTSSTHDHEFSEIDSCDA